MNKFWWDFYYSPNPNEEIQIGIESEDKNLTFDGHFVCLIPKRFEETDLEGCQFRAQQIVNLLNR